MKSIIGRALIEIVIAVQKLWRAVSDLGHWLRGLLRRRPHYVEQQWRGFEPGPIDGKVCVFVHFERKGVVHEFVLFYLRALKTAGFKIVFVSNAPALTPAGLEAVRGIAHLVLRRANVGYDFGAYRDGLSVIPDWSRLDFLLLANDSVYGPFSPISDMLASIDTSRAQFWGLTDSWERAYHLQSYFLLFSRPAIQHEAFARFWRGVRYVNAKSYVIRRYELGLSRRLMEAGLRGEAMFSAREASRAVIAEVDAGALNNPALDGDTKAYLERMHAVVSYGGTLNISHFFWDWLILRMGCPFLKRELLEKNPVAVPYVSRWRDVIADVGDYDTDLIARHLELTLRNRAV